MIGGKSGSSFAAVFEWGGDYPHTVLVAALHSGLIDCVFGRLSGGRLLSLPAVIPAGATGWPQFERTPR